MAAAAVAGTVSQATGGKFANGAMTGAFIHLFNSEASSLLAYGEKVYDTVGNYFGFKEQASQLEIKLQLVQMERETLNMYDKHLEGKSWSDPQYMYIYIKEDKTIKMQ